MTRQQIFQLVGLRPTSSQRVRLGAGRDGRLVAIAHDVTMHTSPQRGVRRADRRRGSRPLRRAQPLDAPPADAARPAARGGRPRAGRGAGPAGGRVGDGRAGAMRSGWIRSSCGSGTSPRSIPSAACRSATAGWSSACAKGRAGSAGSAVPRGPASLRDGRWLVGYGMAAAIRMHFQAADQGEGPDGPGRDRRRPDRT